MFFETKRSIEKHYIYTQTDENLAFCSHVHNSYEFITVLEGELECSAHSESFLLKKGMAMLIPPNHEHSYETKGSSRSFLCVFSSDYVADFHKDMQSCRGGEAFSLFPFTDGGEIELLRDPGTNKYTLRSVLYGICGRAVETAVRYFDEGGSGELSVKLLRYVQENYNNPISLKQISQEIGYNYTYLSNVFNKIFGCGFSRFVNRFRSQNAAELLTTTNQSMVQISNACGFESLRSFNKQFKQDYGVSPTEYRVRHRRK